MLSNANDLCILRCSHTFAARTANHCILQRFFHNLNHFCFLKHDGLMIFAVPYAWDQGGDMQGYLLSCALDGSVRVWAPNEPAQPNAVLEPTPNFSHPSGEVNSPPASYFHILL